MPRRLAKLRITTELLLQWLTIGTIGFVLVEHQLPPDSRVVEARVVDQSYVELIIESSDFPPLEPLADVPWLDAPCFRGRPVSFELVGIHLN